MTIETETRSFVGDASGRPLAVVNKLQVAVARLAPDTGLAEMHRKEAEPGSAA